MQNLFSLYVPKHFGKNSLLPDVLKDFLRKSASTQFELTISPGYLGEGEAFIRQAYDIFAGHVSHLTIYRGMTSLNRFNITSRDLQCSLCVLVRQMRTKNDHRKMMFFRNANNTEAILIGSSNFSAKTYFGKDKGEADLLLFYDNSACEYYRKMINEGGEDNTYSSCVLSESIAMRDEPQQYLDSIYHEFISNAV